MGYDGGVSARSRRRDAPRWNSLVAAAQVMTAPNVALTASVGKVHAWQRAAWDYYDGIGELRFGANWIGNAMSRVNLVAAAAPARPGDEPTPIDPSQPEFTPVQVRAAEIVGTIAGGASTQGQIMSAFGLHLTIAGLAWLVIEPDPQDPLSDRFTHWHVYSSEEVRAAVGGDGIEVQIDERAWRLLPPEAVVVKCWRRHPRRSWESDAPTHGVLSVLREIDLLQKHITASAQSRLAGAGLLAIPSEAVFPPGQGPQSSQNVDPDDENITSPEDTFVDTLVEAMTVPITDRSSAAAVVPLVVKIPGEYVDKVRHISFATPFDERVLSLMEGAIKRLALGMDIPPEVLTGTSGMNHWGAWQVQEEAITLHIEPLSEVVTNALTVGYLLPALLAEGYSQVEAESVMVWYDTTDLTSRPDKSGVAREAYDRMELSGEALLRELGLSIEDAPTPQEKRERILLGVATSAPGLAPAMLAELGYLAEAVTVAEIPAPTAAPVVGAPPAAEDTRDLPPTAPVEVTGAPPEVITASYLLVHRALERAGSRLRGAAGRSVKGGAAAIQCDDPARLHLSVVAHEHADLTDLLTGAWSLAPDIARRSGVDPARLVRTLDSFTRLLLASQEELTYGDLAAALVESLAPAR